MPAFSALNVHNMFDDMMDIVSQLVLKWERSVFSICQYTFASSFVYQIWPREED